MENQKKILVIGSLNMDLVTQVEQTPRVGETVAGRGLIYNPGGKGANQAVAMGKLGADVTMVGMVGDDVSGEELKQNLAVMNVHDKVGLAADAPTGMALIMVNDNADNSIVVIEGANGNLKPEIVQKSWFDNMDILVMQLEVPMETVSKCMALARESGLFTVLNPAPAKVLSKELLNNLDLLVVNETEFETLSGTEFKDPQDLAHGYEMLGVKSIVLTLGENGAWYFDGDQLLHVPAYKVKAVDTTAAGDSFIGGLLTKISKGSSMKEALEFATEVAAFTVTRLGAQKSLPTLEELLERRKL
ncbi:MAG: ribokinase [Bacillota bacterium]|nr:ribokinase [Bacillota bacterium]